MNASLDVVDAVAKRCGKQLGEWERKIQLSNCLCRRSDFIHAHLLAESYQQCLLSTGNDLGKCEPQRQALTDCAGDAVPIMGKIRQSCSPHIASFNQCLSDNKDKSDKEVEARCAPALREMLECSNSVRRAEGLEDVGLVQQK